MPVVANAVLSYCRTNKPVLKYEEVENGTLDNKEYVIDACIKASTFEKMLKKYKPLGVKSIKEAKELSAEKYENAFKIPAPEGYANEDGNYYILKVRKHAMYPSGDATPAPKIVGVTVGKDVNGVAVGPTILMGNGTVGNVQFKERKYQHKDKPGMSLDLVAVQVVQLVEYSNDELEFEVGEDPDGDEFGDGGNFVSEDESRSNTPEAQESSEDEDWN